MDQTIRPANTAALFKLETTEGVDAGPIASDAFPFEEDGITYNSPFAEEGSGEVTGSLVAGVPMVIGKPAEVTIRFRLKGANTTYTGSVKPPHHALLSAAGLRGLFSAAITAAALTAGGASSATLGTGFSTSAQAYRGMPLILSGSGAPGEGRTTFVSDYTAGKVATLVDVFGTPLSTATFAALPANWTYAGTSPADAAARATDHPSGTLYIYEDGTLLKFVGMRGVITEFGGDTAKAGFMTIKFMGIFAGITDASKPAVSVPLHLAPILAQGSGRLDPAFLINGKPLPIDKWALNLSAEQESPTDPNTAYGFGPSIIGKRAPRLECDPKKTLVATRNILTDIENSTNYPGIVRYMGSAQNRYAVTLPRLQPVQADPDKSGSLRSERHRYAATSPGQDANTRDGDSILAFW